MSLSVKKLVATFLDWAGEALAAGTVLAYSHQLNKLITRCGRKKVEQLKPTDITRWAKTWHEVQSVIRLLNWATHEAKLIEKNPIAGLTPPPRDHRRRILTPRQMVEVLRAAEPPGRSYLLGLRETFARPQEIRLATWEDLQSEDPSIDVKEALPLGKCLIVLRRFKDCRRRKETSKPRVLLINQRLGRHILRLLARRRPGQSHIWSNSIGKPWSNNAVRCLIRRLREKLGVKPDRWGETIVAYTFRHSVATLITAKGIKDRTLADLLGHVETRTTLRYQHLDVVHLRAALEQLQEQQRRLRRTG